MVALAEALRKAELHKNDLDLELQILEEAAEMVIEEEKEGQNKNGVEGQTKECEEEDESSSSSSSEEEEENSSSSSEEEVDHGRSSQEREHGESLIQELGEKLEEELRIKEDVPQITALSSSTAGEGAREGEVERLRKTDDSQLPVGLDGVRVRNAASGTALLEHQQRNVRIINAEELDSDDEDGPNQ